MILCYDPINGISTNDGNAENLVKELIKESEDYITSNIMIINFALLYVLEGKVKSEELIIKYKNRIVYYDNFGFYIDPPIGMQPMKLIVKRMNKRRQKLLSI